ncbi:carboxylic ester hydrolase [Spirochaetia bacterium]|nr:carboxylic ester hydrolase [Spirochaetia bacterium]GHU32418.1 carboxylic ester hydrolase [Spirochaetia bacterium]
MKKLMGMLSLCGIFAMVALPVAANGRSSPSLKVVQTLYGLLEGTHINGITYFKGVPFAKPPVGELRWAAPQDPDPWTGVRAANEYAPMAPQVAETNDWWGPDFYYDYIDKPIPISEDCLYLNIVTPSLTGTEKLPVFVWFHGGAFMHGYSYEPEFEASKLAAKGVVVVTAAYRLGMFGYLATPELSAASSTGTSGNYALLDQIKSIEWVKKNIAAFGGDPENITIGGQSAGAVSVTNILTSPLAKGLFQRAIMSSIFDVFNTFQSFVTKERVYESSKKYLTEKGYENLSVEQLRALPTEAFIGPDTTRGDIYGRGFLAYLDDYVVTENPKDYFLKPGALNGIDLFFGSNSGESNASFAWSTISDINAAAKTTYGDLYDKYNFEKLYKGTDDIGATFESLRLRSELQGTRHLIIAEVLSKLNPDSNIYPYYFTHWTPYRESEIRWAWHSSELWYSFNSLRPIPEQRDWQPLDYKIANDFSSYWANFMKTGNPNGRNLPYWPAVKPDSSALMELGDTFKLRENFYNGTKLAPRDTFMREYLITSHNLESYYQ